MDSFSIKSIIWVNIISESVLNPLILLGSEFNFYLRYLKDMHLSGALVISYILESQFDNTNIRVFMYNYL